MKKYQETTVSTNELTKWLNDVLDAGKDFADVHFFPISDEYYRIIYRLK